MKKIISIALAVLMVVSLLPLTAFAGNTEKLAVAQLRTALINGGFVKGLDVADNTLAAVKALFANDAEKISAFNGSTELSDSDLVGTGTQIRLTVNSAVTDSVTAILYGDVNGDGAINDDDFDLIVDEAVMGIDSLEDGSVYEKAADTNNDGVIDGFDLALVDLESNGIAAIDQRGDLPAALVEEIDKATVGTNGVVTIGGEDITVKGTTDKEVGTFVTVTGVANKTGVRAIEVL